MTDGNDIRDARQRAGLTQAELAKLVGVSQRTVGNWERGETVAHTRIARIEQVLAGHWKNDDSPQVGLSSASDVELLAEIARRFARTPMEAGHESQQGQGTEGPQHGRKDRSEDGSQTGRSGAPIVNLHDRYPNPQTPAPPAKGDAAAFEPRHGSEGVRQSEEAEKRGEENQDEGSDKQPLDE